jgi:RNA polymerase sigma factor (sigma-70 family)
MTSRAVILEHTWDFVVPRSIDDSQRWVLTAMQSHGQELVGMLWRILGNEQDVCDAYQDTFLRLAHHEGGQKPENVKAYVFRSASNIAISILRHKIIEKNGLASTVPENRDVASHQSDLDAEYLREALRCSIAQLPENLRDVVTLHDLGDLSYIQVGKILGITAATARVYRCRAVQLLSVWMNKEKDRIL